MPDATDLTDIILAQAALPIRSESDAQSAEGQPLPDLLATQKHFETKAALAVHKGNGWGSIGRARVIPPGGV